MQQHKETTLALVFLVLALIGLSAAVLQTSELAQRKDTNQRDLLAGEQLSICSEKILQLTADNARTRGISVSRCRSISGLAAADYIGKWVYSEGRGIFSGSVLLMRKKGHDTLFHVYQNNGRLRLGTIIAEGDRCDKGIESAFINGKDLEYTVYLTPQALLTLSPEQKKLPEFPQTSQSSCAASIRYINTTPTQITILDPEQFPVCMESLIKNSMSMKYGDEYSLFSNAAIKACEKNTTKPDKSSNKSTEIKKEMDHDQSNSKE